MKEKEEGSKRTRPEVSREAKEKWDRAIAEQQEVARNPRPQSEAEEFARQISHVSPLEWLRQFTI